jgi:hypothetical protein
MSILKFIYELVPLKKHFFNVIKLFFRLNHSFYKHLTFKGVFEVKITEDYKITNEVVFTSQVNNIRDYMDCCDLQVHLSESEAGNNVVKEFALLGKPSIICKNVGDFEDYRTSENSYLI